MYREVPWVRIPLSPPFSLPVQRLPARTPAQPEKSPRFRGVLAVEPWRFRTGDCGFRAGKTARPVFVSVAELGGSVSPPTRPGRLLALCRPLLRKQFMAQRIRVTLTRLEGRFDTTESEEKTRDAFNKKYGLSQ